jgi:hypothetical protein
MTMKKALVIVLLIGLGAAVFAQDAQDFDGVSTDPHFQMDVTESPSPIHITIYNYIDRTPRQQLPAPPLVPAAAEPYIPAAADTPAPDTGRSTIYRIQVGAYSSNVGASVVFMQLRDAGFDPAYEYFNNLFRVVIEGFSASEIPRAREQLAALGFTDMWVRE